MIKIYFLLLSAFILFFNNESQACTTAIVSGKYTVDGRPLLFKHRDSGKLQNKIMYFQDGKYDYQGLVNSNDKKGHEVWAGCNSAGFAIMNSANYNMNLQDTSKLKDNEGFVMKKALQSCATLKDFEELLRSLPKPMGVDANFGVIDAIGGAAYYETNNYSYTKFDANNPVVAPFGYIIRTNFAFTGDREEEYGLIRFQNAENLFHLAANKNALSHNFILREVSRSLRHSLTNVDMSTNIPEHYNSTRFMDFNDFIPRYSSATTTVVQGILQNDDPMFTTMWTVLGFQLSSVAIPTWIAGGPQLPQILMADRSGNAPLCERALTLKKEIFPLTKGSFKKYVNQASLVNNDGTGIMQKLQPLEETILTETKFQLNKWRNKKPAAKEIQKYYHWLDKTVDDFYRKEFNL